MRLQCLCEQYIITCLRGARWPSGRASDSGARGWRFDTYLRRVVSLSKDTFTPQKVLVIPRKRWLSPHMTEKLFNGMLTLKALGIFLPDSRYWLSIFFRFCTKSVLFYAAHCMSKSILGPKRTIPDHNRCHSHQKRRKPDRNR